MNTIIGKRVILFDFAPNDLDHFTELHREDKNGVMGRFCLAKMTEDEAKNYITLLITTGQIKIWSVFTKEGKATRKVGYIYLTEISPFSCQVVGILDKSIIKGISKFIRRGKYTFSEDALRTISKWAFNGAGFHRIEYRTFSNNILSRKLAEKSGFIKEGTLRKSFRIDDKFLDVVIYSALKNEYIA